MLLAHKRSPPRTSLDCTRRAASAGIGSVAAEDAPRDAVPSVPPAEESKAAPAPLATATTAAALLLPGPSARLASSASARRARFPGGPAV